MLFQFGLSYFKGLVLGGGLCLLGYVLDFTVSAESQDKIIKHKSEHFVQAHKYIIQNLVFISPFVYALVDNTLLDHTTPLFSAVSIGKYFGVLITQNIGYFFVHREMHRNRSLYVHHKFHHQFDTIVSPSLGNAVSHTEFIIAYVFPFLVGAFIFRPNEFSYLAAISTVGFGNLFIHTYELNHMWWIPGFVSPTKHIKHHEIRDQHYAAPIFDIDAMYEFVDM